MPNVADMVVGFGLDDSKWVAGVLRIQNQAKQLGGAIGSSSGGLGRGIAQGGYMLQDFTSVLSAGGKNALGRAMMSTMNNVQMLGSAFGPWGLAITSVAGGLGSFLIPKLLESGEAVETLSDKIGKSVEEMGKMADQSMALQKSLTSIMHIDTSKDLKERLGDIKGERTIVAGGRKELEARLTKMYEDAVAGGLLENSPGKDIESRIVKSPTVKGMWGTSVAGAVETKEALMKGLEALQKMQDEERKLSAMETAGGVRLRELRVKEADKAALAAGKKDLERRMEAYADDLEAQEKAIKASRTPLEVAKDRMIELKDLQARGFLTNDQAAAAATDTFKDFVKTRHLRSAQEKNEAAVGGTSEGFSSVMASIREAQGQKADEQIATLKEIVDLFKQALGKVDAQPPIRVESL